MSPWYRNDDSAGELKTADCSASAFSWKNTHLIAALWAAGLQMSQDTNERLVQHANKTAVASPTAKHWLSACFLSCSSGQHFSTPYSMPESDAYSGAFLTKGATFPLEQMRALEGKLSQHLVTVCDLSEKSVIWGGQRKTWDDKVWRINSTEVSKLRANPFQSWR